MTARTAMTKENFEALISPLDILEKFKAPLVAEFSKHSISIAEGETPTVKVLQEVESIYSEFVTVGIQHRMTSIVLKAEQVKGEVLASSLASSSSSSSSSSEEIEEIRQELEAKQREIDSLDEDLDDYEDELDELESSLNEIQNRLEAAQLEQSAQAPVVFDSLESFTNANQMVKKPITVTSVDMMAKANTLKAQLEEMNNLLKTVPQEVEMYRGFYPLGMEVQ